jgi:hypothetical protein
MSWTLYDFPHVPDQGAGGLGKRRDKNALIY